MISPAAFRRVRAWTAVLAIGALFIGACSSSSKSPTVSGGSSGSTTTSLDNKALGTPNKASGSPITVGFLSDGQNAAVDFTDELAAFNATIQYINDYLGGIAGHPIAAHVCTTNADPTRGKACGDEFVSAKVPVVIMGVTTQGETVATTLKAAGIPVFAYGATSQTVLATAGNANLINSLGLAFGGAAKVAQQKGTTKAALFVLNIPELASITPLATVLYKNAGARLNIVPVGSGTDFSDMNAKVNAELAKNPTQIAIVGQASFTAAAIRAARDAGFKGTTVILDNTVTPEVGQTIGGFDGVDVIGTTTTDAADPDRVLFNAVLDKYSPSTRRNLNAPGGFAVALSFARALHGLTGEFTIDTYKAALAAMPVTPLALGGGVTFQCNGSAVKDPVLKAALRATCTSQVLHSTLDKDGKSSKFEILDLNDLLKLG